MSCKANSPEKTEIQKLYDKIPSFSCKKGCVDCCDNYATRYLIDDTCHKLSKPWVFGAIGQFEGRVGAFLPGGARFSDIFAEREILESQPPSSGGVLGAVPGIVGAIEAAEAIKIICRFGQPLANSLLYIDVKTMTFNKIEI